MEIGVFFVFIIVTEDLTSKSFGSYLIEFLMTTGLDFGFVHSTGLKPGGSGG